MFWQQIWIVLFSIFAFGYSMQEPMAMEIFPQIFTINCFGASLHHINPFAQTEHIDKINITQCSIPKTSYADVLQLLNVNINIVTSLTLDSVVNWNDLRGIHFKGLNLTELIIHNPDDRHMVILPRDLTSYLKRTLKVLKVVRVKMYPIPEDVSLENVTLIRGFTLEKWGGCLHMKRMDVMHWVTPAFEKGWLPHCTNLEELTLFHAMEQTVRHTLIGLRSVRKLTVRKCALLYITRSMFADAPLMRQLSFTQHSIYGIDPLAFKEQSALEVMDMSHNELSDCSELSLVYSPLRSLKSLTLAYNPLKNFCGSWNKTDLAIEHLSLRSTQLTRLCFSEWRHLLSLDLAANNITELQIADLPASGQRERPLEVNLRKNPINKLPSTEGDYQLMTERFNKGSKVLLHLDLTISCDCAHAWFARALHAVPRLRVTGVTCETGEDVYRISLTQLECTKWRCSNCWCRRRWGGAVTADCGRRDLTGLPPFGGERDGDHDGESWPRDLELIDLRNNRLSSLTSEETSELFSSPNRTVWLSGNPLLCDCGTAGMVEVLMRHREQILDFDSLTCVNNGNPLSKIIPDELCEDDLAHMWPVLAIVAVLATLVSILATLYWRYSQQIKMFLYTRGLCLSCLHEEEIDSERIFDAFIAFSHEDDDFVNDDLLPGLFNYKVCVHYKNWIPGDWIPAQIARSIEQSKRTIIVLSKNFLQSPWGMLEFRMAHAAMLHEGRARIIAIVTDDVIESSRLDPELKGYLAANTYIVWGDPWFFDKLKYALPHKRNFDENIKHCNESTEFRSIEAKGFF